MFVHKLLLSKYSNKPCGRSVPAGGFTIVEMAILVMVGGMILSLLGSYLLSFMEKNRIDVTEIRLNQVEKSILKYLDENGHYPCPASRGIGPSTIPNAGNPDFGRSVALSCNSGGLLGTVRSAGVRIGAVPTRTLNLSDEYMMDGWGNKFTYAVTENLATPQQYASNLGGITILNTVPLITQAHYILLSHGHTGKGAFMFGESANAVIGCNDGVANLDDENCNDDAVFRTSMIDLDTNPANFFDDHVHYAGQYESTAGMPAGAVIILNESHIECPAGWRRYQKAEGRIAIGAGVSTPPMPQALIVPEGVSLEMNLDPGASYDGSSGAAPAYIVLTFCKKLPEVEIKSNVKIQ